MTRLVALDLAGGERFVQALVQTWEAGDAVAPIDRRLPAAARDALLSALRPHAIVDAHGVEHPFDAHAPRLDDGDALVVTTSGSTGSPKVIVHTRTSLTAHAEAVHSRLGVQARSDRWLACLPLNHLGGFGVVARSVLGGIGVDVLPGFDATSVAEAPQRLGSTRASLVATALDRVDAHAFRTIVLGGSGDAATRPANVVHTYGLTETGGGVVYDGVPLEGVDIRIDSEGQISLRGPSMARGRRLEDGAVVPLTGGDGWLSTGDHGRWDGDHLIVDGRIDDLIITGGENVWPAAVEAVVAQHAAVAEVAVVGLEDPEWGQSVVAVVVLRPGQHLDLVELRTLVKDHLPSYAAPRRLVVQGALPRTSLGKVDRLALQQVGRSEPGAGPSVGS